MELKPEYKQTEVGVIPVDWVIQSLDKLTDSQRPISYGIVQTGPIIPNGVKCLRVVDIENGQINKNDLITTTQTISNAYKRTILRTGDLVMPLRGKVGDVALVDQDLVGANLTRGVALIAIRSDMSALFFKQLISSIAMRNKLAKSMNGSALQEIPIVTLRAFKVGFPPSFAEQTVIANALSDADALIQSLIRLIAKKRQIKQGAMQTLLNPYENGRLKEGWVVKKLGEVADIDPENLNASVNPNYKFKYISLEDVDRGVLRNYSDQIFETAPSRARRIVKKGDILFGTVRPNLQSHCLIKNHEEDLVCSTGFAVIRCRNNIANPPYIFSLFFAEFVEEQIQTLLAGSNYPAINSSDVRKLDIPLPQMEEQTHIAKILSNMDAEIAALEAKLVKYRHIKQGMMQNLLTGRIRLVQPDSKTGAVA